MDSDKEPDLEFVTTGDVDKEEITRTLQEAMDAVNEGMADLLESFGMEPFTLDILFED